ncbi:uncharacterized protein LOC119070165 [Bradysia coprophila]|uniref:uncharacterized protein LOC119070165 n=1 Tax=Bradysia coprophila TaxID=38358 RepID=UPI00187D8EEF|nr:uncharacterized protein LOC119070165 [Bradysia coprophila]
MASKAPNVYSTRSCQCCPNVDTDDMVQCDCCDSWFHFTCVGVRSSISTRDWQCDKCKYTLPKSSSLAHQDKENRPPQKVMWRETKSFDSMSSVSSKRSRNLALQRLEEDRALSEKRDREYLRRKYSILEDDELEVPQGEEKIIDESSFENVLRWTKDMHDLSKDYTNKFTMDDVSISLGDHELTNINQRFVPLAQSSANVRQPKSSHTVQRKTMGPLLTDNQLSTSNPPIDKARTTIGKLSGSSTEVLCQCSNPFCALSHRAFNTTEVSHSKPLQSRVNDNDLETTYSVVTDNNEPIIGGVRRKQKRPNLIQPSKLHLADPTIRQSVFCFGKENQLPSTNSCVIKKADESRNNRFSTGFKFTNAPQEFRPQIFSHDVKRPRIDNDRFGFSKSKTSKPFLPYVDKHHQSTRTFEHPIRQSNSNASVPAGNTPAGNTPAGNTLPASVNCAPSEMNSSNPSRYQNNSSIIPYSGHQPIDFRKICFTHVELTANQIASRHTMNRRLPQFFGEPTKWQMFESAFVYSTMSCGLMNHENLSRLTDSLQGVAMKAVKSRLLHPDSVPGVMETLRLMFGRPELIIQSLLEEIDRTTAPKSDDLKSLIMFSISVKNLCATIESFGAVEHLRNPNLMRTLTDKLPSQIQLNWAFYKHQVRDVNVAIFGNWLYELATVASDVVTVDTSAEVKNARKEIESKSSKKDNYVNVHNGAKTEAKSQNSAAVSTKNSKVCPACKKDICKVLAYCETFKRLKRPDKWKLVKSNNLCGCCLGNHRYFNCQQKILCGVAGCSLFHHVLLHNDSKTDESEKQVSNINATNKTCNSMASSVLKFPEIFRIVPVNLFFNGVSTRIFVYFDDGSNLTTMDRTLAQKIGLHGSQESLCVKWSFGDSQVESDSRIVSVQISGIYDGAEEFTLDDVRTVNKLQLPSQSITKNWLSKFPHFKNLPITPYRNAVPQMIIGLNYSRLMVSLETIEGNWNQPIACRTRLGWVVQGPNDEMISSGISTKISLNMCVCQSSDNNLHQLVKEYFSLESFDVKIPDRVVGSKELIRAYDILEKSTIKKDNHYEASLLWRKDDVTLPNSYDMAKRRLECVESKMRKDPHLAKRICDYFKDFINKDYIRKLSYEERQKHGPRTWYLPVFPVFNPKKPEKLRLVWDGAAKVKGVSLNSELLAGPDQLVPLTDILRRFREACIGLSTDIIEMFHRIYVNNEDQDSQRFLWRDGNANKEPEVFVVNVLTFGSNCSPAVAQFVKNKNAKEFEREFPKAVEAITKNHYVDDMIERAHDVDSAVQLIKNVQFIHRHANFELRNLISNNQQVLEAINGSPEFNDKILVDKLDIDVERILGMYWNTKTDTFTYSLQFIKLKNMTEEHCPTKREVLRVVMSVFDPLGFLAHLLIHPRVLIQEIWRHDIGWDVQLPLSLKSRWLEWVKHLMQVEHLHIPRLYSTRLSPTRPKSIQLHVFVDASIEAYATAAYFRIENQDGVDSCLVGAKSRVAPNRPMSIPRLELQGAVLGNRFAESILQSHYSLDFEKIIFWCDSKTVLFWLNTEPRRYSQFVAFRLGEILDSKINAQWRWIPSEFNVADEATKTETLPELSSSSRWFAGPEFLRNQNPEFSFDLDEPDFTTEEEVRPFYLLTHLHVPMNTLLVYENFPHWNRLHRTMAFVLRFIRNSKLQPQERSFGVLASNELLAAENCLYRQIQYESFKEEILIIRWNETAPLDKHKDFDNASIIRTCSPYLDKFGVLRVMSRLDNAHSISETARRPIILDRNHFVTRLIVDSYHRKYRHLHHQTVLNEIRQKFWIPKLRVVVNSIRDNCQKCKNSAAIPRIPEMGSIPEARLAVFTRPFTFTGVDYFGPLYVIVNRGTQKRWGALFTCMTTRAIHLEIAHSMDTSSCIMAIRNFEGRKGTPRKYFSDHGTNFHGANNVFTAELALELAKLDYEKIREEFVTSETSWSFNPPKGAHMGGVWERMVGIVKVCLDEVLTVRYPTDEMLKSLFVEVERIVNSRPLTYVSLAHPDDEVLTPNHFIFGSSNGTKPPGEFIDADLLRQNWRTIQAMSEKFWQKFVVEYLPTLMRRTKWFRKVEPLKVHDVVLLVDSSFKRNTWPKGIVVETFMDKSGQVRKARVRTATGTIFERPVSHLARLDVDAPTLVKPDSSNQLTGGRMSDNTDNDCPIGRIA